MNAVNELSDISEVDAISGHQILKASGDWGGWNFLTTSWPSDLPNR